MLNGLLKNLLKIHYKFWKGDRQIQGVVLLICYSFSLDKKKTATAVPWFGDKAEYFILCSVLPEEMGLLHTVPCCKHCTWSFFFFPFLWRSYALFTPHSEQAAVGTAYGVDGTWCVQLGESFCGRPVWYLSIAWYYLALIHYNFRHTLRPSATVVSPH